MCRHPRTLGWSYPPGPELAVIEHSTEAQVHAMRQRGRLLVAVHFKRIFNTLSWCHKGTEIYVMFLSSQFSNQFSNPALHVYNT